MVYENEPPRKCNVCIGKEKYTSAVLSRLLRTAVGAAPVLALMDAVITVKVLVVQTGHRTARAVGGVKQRGTIICCL
mgnify:CR=1 FL=1